MKVPGYQKTVFFILAAGILAGCGSQPGELSGQGPVPQSAEEAEAYEVADHKTKAEGLDIPEWVTRYIGGGLTGVEGMIQFYGRYVFVGENSGTNPRALRQWSSGFTVDQDLARLVAARVQARLAAPGNPDETYGRYFEAVIKSASDASYTGARRETDFWLLKRYLAEDGTTDREAYDFYVLVSIDKAALEERINAILNGITTELPPTREQSAAINRVKEAFFEGF
jgi:hypothetical protein